MPVSFAAHERPSASGDAQSKKTNSILKKRSTKRELLEEDEPSIPAQIVSTVFKPFEDLASLLVPKSIKIPEVESQDVKAHTSSFDSTQQHKVEKTNILTMTCIKDGAGMTKHIKICPKDTYEDFIDLIKNEYGEELWPVYQDPATGKRLIVIDDERFDELCAEAAAEGGRIHVLVFKQIEAKDYELV